MLNLPAGFLNNSCTGVRGLMRGMATVPQDKQWSETKLEDSRRAWGEQVRET